VIQAHLRRPDFTSSVVQTASATAASSWLEMPKIGNNWLMPPSGSCTPTQRKYPHRPVTTALVMTSPGFQLTFLNGR